MVLKYLDALQTNNSNLKENLINVYKERKEHFEFFGNRKQFINNQISKITQSPSTIQVNTSDDSNNHFSITFSSGYGSGVQCKNTGMYLNNSLGEIELNPQGFLGDTKNERLISNMSPMIIETNKGISTIGSPGADRISSALGQVILNFSQFLQLLFFLFQFLVDNQKMLEIERRRTAGTCPKFPDLQSDSDAAQCRVQAWIEAAAARLGGFIEGSGPYINTMLSIDAKTEDVRR